MILEERLRKIVEANRGDEEALIRSVLREMALPRAGLPIPAYLDAIASRLEVAALREVDLPDGTTFDAADYLRQAARLVRLAVMEEAEPEEAKAAEASRG